MCMNRYLPGVLLGAIAFSLTAQTVLFNDPVPWATMRSRHLVLKAQVDTASVAQGGLSVDVYAVIDGQSRLAGRKRFNPDDYSMVFDMGSIGRDLVGGHDYFRIDWSVAGSDDKGSCYPVGFAVLEKKEPPVIVRADSTSSIEAYTGPFDVTVGQVQFAALWNKNYLAFSFRRDSEITGYVELFIDGKNAKNAFLSYPDRVIRYFPHGDSAVTRHYTRSLKGDVIEYAEQEWHTDFFTVQTDEVTIVLVPWYDPGVIPFVDRTVGFAAFYQESDGTLVAYPSQAQREVPATWGNLVLVR